MNAEIKAGIHNKFDIEVIDARTGKVRQKAKAENVVCDGYWAALQRMATGDSLGASYTIKYILYGSGSGIPSASDTDLFDYKGYKVSESHTITYDSELDCAIRKFSVTLGISEANGVTLTEVGLMGSGGVTFIKTDIVSHAMLTDMNGNPISIEKTDTDIINIHATIFLHVSDAVREYIYLNNSFAYSSTYKSGQPDYGIVPWMLGVSVVEQWNSSIVRSYPCRHVLPSRTIPNDGSYRADATQVLSASYSRANKTLTLSARFGVDFGNVDGGIKYLVLMDGQYDSSSPSRTSEMKKQFVIPVGAGIEIEGYDINADSIGTGDGSRTAFQTHFDVARDFVLKVNGTVVSNFTRDGRIITFSAAPDVGAVVTADYFTDTIPKDENHVYDLTVTISFGEYTPE